MDAFRPTIFAIESLLSDTMTKNMKICDMLVSVEDAKTHIRESIKLPKGNNSVVVENK